MQLSRLGDVLNILPLAKLWWRQSGERTAFCVHPQFADILDGLEYVDVVRYDGEQMNPPPARDWMRERGYEAFLTQVVGNDEFPPRLADSFATESWERCGALADYHADILDLGPVKDIESPLLGVETGIPRLAVNLTGHSASLPPADQTWLKQHIARDLSSHFQIVDLTGYKAANIRDVHSILAKCEALLTVDTCYQHIAGSLDLPTCVLVPDRHWHTPEPKRHWVGRVGYAEACTEAGWRRVALTMTGDNLMGSMVRDTSQMLGREICIITHNKTDIGERGRRLEMAKLTRGIKWTDKYHGIFTGRGDSMSGDFWDTAVTLGNDRDILVWAEDDVCFIPEAMDVIRRAMHQSESVYGYSAITGTVKTPLTQRDIADLPLSAAPEIWAMTKRLTTRVGGKPVTAAMIPVTAFYRETR